MRFGGEKRRDEESGEEIILVRLFLSHSTHRINVEAMSALRQLKNYTPHCPFLHRASSLAARSLSTSTIAARNPLSSRASLCPVISLALPSTTTKSIHTTALVNAPAPGGSEGIKSNGAGQQTQIRNYASIASQESTVLQQASIGKDSGDAAEILKELEGKGEVIIGHRPTNALGFAERMAERGGGFQFEQFYQGEIDKKLKDKSQSCSILSRGVVELTMTALQVTATSIISIDSLVNSLWLILPIRRMRFVILSSRASIIDSFRVDRRSQYGVRTTTSVWDDLPSS